MDNSPSNDTSDAIVDEDLGVYYVVSDGPYESLYFYFYPYGLLY
jgi:hypothetical protein